MKITRRQLKKIIREERQRLLEADGAVFGLFNEDYLYDILSEEVENYLQSAGGDTKLRKDEIGKMETAMMSALQKVFGQYGA